jgi:hypothetical protein
MQTVTTIVLEQDAPEITCSPAQRLACECSGKKYKRRRACVPCYASLVKRNEREKRPGAMSGPDRLCNDR